MCGSDAARTGAAVGALSVYKAYYRHFYTQFNMRYGHFCGLNPYSSDFTICLE